MKVASIETVINAPFPTKACGHIEQDFLIDTYKDDLYLRIFGLEEDDKLFLHLSFDLLGLKENICNKITESAQSIFKNKRVHCVVSCTHTHYGNDINNSEYILFLLKKVREAFQNMEFKEYGQLYYSIYIERYNKIGKSRISDYETNNEYLFILQLKSGLDQERILINLIMHNVHPTILKSTSPFFSSEFPGQVLQILKKQNPDVFFTYVTGAAGDISTRFTRKTQDYSSVIEMGEKLAKEVMQLLNMEVNSYPLNLSIQSAIINYDHSLKSIDMSILNGNKFTQREFDTILNGEIMRKRLMEHPEQLARHAHVTVVNFGEYSLIFYPNEIFSQYLNEINLKRSMLISYSNGYEPYILPIDFHKITYEMFLDTLSKETKKTIVKFLNQFQ